MILPVKRGDVCKLPVRWAKAQVQLDPELARDLVPVEGKNGVGVCSVTGKLSVRDNKFILEVINFRCYTPNACFNLLIVLSDYLQKICVVFVTV